MTAKGNMYRSGLISLLFLFFITIGCSTVSTIVQSEKEHEVIFYTTYAYSDGDEWVIPLRIHVHHRRESVERFFTSLASWRYDLNEDEKYIFRSRVNDIVADSEWRENVKFSFLHDPGNKNYQITDDDGRNPITDMNGLKEGYVRLSKSKADSLLMLQNSENGWLIFEAVSNYHTGTGKVQLIEPHGTSVISDIDDTIKITELPAGSGVVIRNTFFKEFEAAPGMPELYNGWDDAVFHYVTGAPWQLYDPLTSFIFHDDQGFPRGSLHMKNLRKNYFNLASWSDLRQLITNENMTKDQKIGQISSILEDFPEREFILVGDSGEKDPEIYRLIREAYPDQIKEIFIRDVINDRENNPERLAGMTIIPAQTVEREISSAR